MDDKTVSPFKVPAIPKAKAKRRVLEEETYLSAMGDIIEKDFFPDLRELRNLSERLDNPERFKPPRLDCDSPATFETPKSSNMSSYAESVSEMEFKDSEENMRKLKMQTGVDMPNLSLDQFVQHFTTEDDESFQERLKENEEKYRKRYSYMCNDEEALNDVQKRLTVPSIEEQAKGVERPLALDTWTYKNKNELMFPPGGVYNQSSSNAGRLINHKNTSLRELPFDCRISKAQLLSLKEYQARAQQGRIGIDGKIIVEAEGTVYDYVRTPSPMPGVSESPLMTWGEIGGTPLRLDGSCTPSFHIQQVPKREKLAMALADKATESHRDEKRKAAEATRPVRVSPSPRHDGLFGSMSPAAQRLAASTLGSRLHSSSRRSPFLSRPSSSRRHTPSASSISPAIKRPVAWEKRTTSPKPSSSAGRSTVTVSESDITDNLLSLSRKPHTRAKAQDFF